MRAVLISDQHDHIFRDDNEELIERILELEPDVVFMDGDMLNADSDDISWLLSEIERLSPKFRSSMRWAIMNWLIWPHIRI